MYYILNCNLKSLAGVSRSATVVTAYIMKNKKKSVSKALEFVKANRQVR